MSEIILIPTNGGCCLVLRFNRTDSLTSGFHHHYLMLIDYQTSATRNARYSIESGHSSNFDGAMDVEGELTPVAHI